MKKIALVFVCVLMLLAALSGCRAEAEMSAFDFAVQCLNSSIEYIEPKIKAAIETGSDINVKDDNGWTALMLLARNEDRAEVFNILIRAGADVDAKNRDGKTALDIAEEKGMPEIAQLLQAAAGRP